MSSNNAGHLITMAITKLQPFPTLHHNSPNYISLHFTNFRRSVLGSHHLQRLPQKVELNIMEHLLK